MEILKNSSSKGEWVAVVSFTQQESRFLTLSEDELLELELPKKQLAKLIAKTTGENPKKIYERLTKE